MAQPITNMRFIKNLLFSGFRASHFKSMGYLIFSEALGSALPTLMKIGLSQKMMLSLLVDPCCRSKGAHLLNKIANSVFVKIAWAKSQRQKNYPVLPWVVC